MSKAAVRQFSSLVEGKLSEASLSPLSPAVTIPLSELKEALPVRTPNLEGLTCSTSARFNLKPSGRPGSVEPALVLTTPVSSEPTLSSQRLAASPSLKALVVLLESESNRLTRRKWQDVLENPEIYHELLCDLAPQIERSCHNIARQRATRLDSALIARGFRAAFRLLKSYNPTKSRLITFLRGNLANRVIDELRTETRDRRYRGFLIEVERIRHTLEQQELRPMRADDPAVAKELGFEPHDLTLKLQQINIHRRGMRVRGGDDTALENLNPKRLGLSADQLR